MNILKALTSKFPRYNLCHNCKFNFNHPAWEVGGVGESTNGNIIRGKHYLQVSGNKGIYANVDLSFTKNTRISFKSNVAPRLAYSCQDWEFKSVVSVEQYKDNYTFTFGDNETIRTIYIEWDGNEATLRDWQVSCRKLKEHGCCKCGRATATLHGKQILVNSIPPIEKVGKHHHIPPIGVFYFVNYNQGLGDMVWKCAILNYPPMEEYKTKILITNRKYFDLCYGQDIDEYWLISDKLSVDHAVEEEYSVIEQLKSVRKFDLIIPTQEQKHAQNRFKRCHKRILDSFQIKTKYPPIIHPNPAYIPNILQYVSSEKKNIICHPRLAGWTKEKNWAEENWVRLIDLIGDKYNVIVTSGKSDERKLAMPKCIDLHQKLLIGDLAALMSKCNLYIGVDSGVTNLAAGVGMSRITILGKNTYKEHGRGRVIELIKDTENDVTPEDVAKEVECYFEKWN